MNERHPINFNQPINGELQPERVPPRRGLMKRLGRLVVGGASERVARGRLLADEMVITTGAQLRPVEDFAGVVRRAPAMVAAIRHLKEQRRILRDSSDAAPEE